MFQLCYWSGVTPKSLEAIEIAIATGKNPPDELVKYKYRRWFKLSAQEMADEPIDQFSTNLLIYGLIQKRKLKEIEKAERRVKRGNRKH